MKKIKLFLNILFLNFIFFKSSVFAVVSSSDVETSQENISIITNFFTKDLLINIVFAIIIIIFTFLLSKFLTSKFTHYIERSAEGEGQSKEELIGVVNRTINIFILSVGFMITLGILGIDTSLIMGGVGVGVGFALKSFITNFLSGILMVTQGHYHNGDLIKVGDQMGRIKTINALFTTVQQFDGIIYFVPNVTFMEESVSNYTANDKRRIEVKVGVDYSTDIVKAKEVLLKVIDNFPNILKAPQPKVLVNEFGDSSINMAVRFWISSDDNYFTIKSNVTETINLAFKKYGIIIPFPQVTLSDREGREKKI